MTPNPATTIRFPEITRKQLAELCKLNGLTQTQLVIMAIDRMYRGQEMDVVSAARTWIERNFSHRTRMYTGRPEFRLTWHQDDDNHVMTIRANEKRLSFLVDEFDMDSFDCDRRYVTGLFLKWFDVEFVPWYRSEFLSETD